MSILDNEDDLETIIHKTFHVIANELDINVDIVAHIIEKYNEIISAQIEKGVIISEN